MTDQGFQQLVIRRLDAQEVFQQAVLQRFEQMENEIREGIRRSNLNYS